MDTVLKCNKCQASLFDRENPEASRITYNTGVSNPCPSCGAEEIIEIFPAMFRPVVSSGPGEALQTQEDAACFYHPGKKAKVPCDGCGRFLCALCDLELNGQHLCPSCLKSGRKKGKLKNLDNERVLYDRIALTTASVPMIFWPLTLFSAPATVYLTIRHWKAPLSLVGSGVRWRFVVACLIALIQIACWIAFIAFLIKRH